MLFFVCLFLFFVRMSSPLFERRTVCFCLKLPRGFYQISANSKGSEETALWRDWPKHLLVAM